MLKHCKPLLPRCSIKNKHTSSFSYCSSSFFGNVYIFRKLKWRRGKTKYLLTYLFYLVYLQVLKLDQTCLATYKKTASFIPWFDWKSITWTIKLILGKWCLMKSNNCSKFFRTAEVLLWGHSVPIVSKLTFSGNFVKTNVDPISAYVVLILCSTSS